MIFNYVPVGKIYARIPYENPMIENLLINDDGSVGEEVYVISLIIDEKLNVCGVIISDNQDGFKLLKGDEFRSFNNNYKIVRVY